MNKLENRLCEPRAWEILELAARYYTEQSQSYTVSELIQAGTETQIPDRFVQQAIQDIRAKQQQKLKQQKRIKQRWEISFNIGFAIASMIILWTIWKYNQKIDLFPQSLVPKVWKFKHF